MAHPSGGYFFIAIIKAAISCASLRLRGGVGMVACGKSRNDTIISEVMVSLAAMDANEGRPFDLPKDGQDPSVVRLRDTPSTSAPTTDGHFRHPVHEPLDPLLRG